MILVGVGNRRSETGSAALELAILAPAFILLLLLAAGTGRIADARMTLDDAAQQAARAASMAFDARGAEDQARLAFDSMLSEKSWACADADVRVDTSEFMRGGRVVVEVHCNLRLTELSTAGLPGISLHAKAIQVIDSYRSMP